MSQKINLIRQAVNRDGLVEQLERTVKSLFKKRFTDIKYITVYNDFRSTDYSIKRLDDYNTKWTPNNTLTTIDDYKALAVTITMNDYSSYPASSWRIMISKWGSVGGN